MFKLDAEKLAKIGMKNMENFTNIAGDFVKHGVRVEDGEPMDDKAHEFFTETFAIGMAMGEAISKRKHILIGVAIGTAGTVVASKINKESKEEENINKIKEDWWNKGWEAKDKPDFNEED